MSITHLFLDYSFRIVFGNFPKRNRALRLVNAEIDSRASLRIRFVRPPETRHALAPIYAFGWRNMLVATTSHQCACRPSNGSCLDITQVFFVKIF